MSTKIDNNRENDVTVVAGIPAEVELAIQGLNLNIVSTPEVLKTVVETLDLGKVDDNAHMKGSYVYAYAKEKGTSRKIVLDTEANKVYVPVSALED